MQSTTRNKGSFWKAFSVAAVFFSSHAGGGFATGNQANTYFVGFGWAGILSSILSMLVLTLTFREAMIMYNDRHLTSYKELFQTLFHPFDKLELLFELFFSIMVVMVIAAAISGAATAFKTYFSMNYYLAVFIVAVLTLVLSIGSANVVRKVGTYMGIGIMVTALLIYAYGIFAGDGFLSQLRADWSTHGFSKLPTSLWNGLVYAGFQCVHLPTMIAVGVGLNTKDEVPRSMRFAFVINSLGLALSTTMLFTWQNYYTAVEGGTTLPTLVSLEAMDLPVLLVVYAVCLILCLISSAVTITFGFVARFENLKLLQSIKSMTHRRVIISTFIIIVSMLISLVGLTRIIKYGYGLNGYLAIAVIIIPFLTVGYVKNYRYRKAMEHNTSKTLTGDESPLVMQESS